MTPYRWLARLGLVRQPAGFFDLDARLARTGAKPPCYCPLGFDRFSLCVAGFGFGLFEAIHWKSFLLWLGHARTLAPSGTSILAAECKSTPTRLCRYGTPVHCHLRPGWESPLLNSMSSFSQAHKACGAGRRESWRQRLTTRLVYLVGEAHRPAFARCHDRELIAGFAICFAWHHRSGLSALSQHEAKIPQELIPSSSGTSI